MDLKSLCDVSRTVYQITSPYLHETCVFEVDLAAKKGRENQILWPVNSKLPNKLQCAKGLHIRSNGYPGYCLGGATIQAATGPEPFDAELLKLFGNVKEDNLEEFWYACISRQLR